MFLASQINELLETNKGKFLGSPTYQRILEILNKVLAKKFKFVFKINLSESYDVNVMEVTGLYDMGRNRKYIILNFSRAANTFLITEKTFRDFKFLISQTCQHELIHQYQWVDRDISPDEVEPIDFRCSCETSLEEKMYLSDPDEIDAYSHDIAMEIKFHYPNEDPLHILKTIDRRRKIPSYMYYKKTFRKDDWSGIRSRLLKKTYKWLPHTTV